MDRILIIAVCFSANFQITIAQSNQPEEEPQTSFIFGGYVKFDFLRSRFANGEPGLTSPIRDIHLPSGIPVGGQRKAVDTEMHVKESRFNFELNSEVMGKPIKGFIEMDFLLSAAGDQRVSNSYNPRLRHFYFQWDKVLLGQTWSTFMVVIIPEDLDFSGAAEGLVFNRQPQFRFTAGSWQFSLENPEATISPYLGGSFFISSGGFPDLVGRKNFSGNWGTLSVAGITRGLRFWDTNNNRHLTSGYGITAGGKFNIGKRNDFRFVATAGQGLGRYIALGFINSTVQDSNDDLKTIGSYNGYISYLHHWSEKWRSSFNVSGLMADNDASLTGPDVNKAAWSASGNLLHYFAPNLMMGVEFMHGYRELENGTNGAFNRLQFSAKYSFKESLYTKKA